ncbi:MAG: RNA-guided endonuclease InsQ/TnpB family protein [Promethearchaeota archaeon]
MGSKPIALTIYRGYKTELKLNNHQKTLCRRHAGCARFAYNWGLQQKIREYLKTGKTPSATKLHRKLNQLKHDQFSWMYKISKCAPQEALRNLDKAFHHFYKRVKVGVKPGFPKFKSRKTGIGSFRLTGIIRVFESKIQLPRLGMLRLKERGYLPEESERVHILSATISEKAGRWFVSLQVKEEIEVVEQTGPVVGIDVGLHRLATISDGSIIENPEALKRKEHKIQRIQKILSRKRRGSKNYRKTLLKYQKLHHKISNVRKDTLHKITTKLAKTKSVIGIEDLNIGGIIQNKRLAKAMSDTSWYKFRQQLKYKTKWYGSKLVVISRFFPSSKRCSRCGKIKADLRLSQRIYKCNNCGLILDRDINASFNLAFVAASWAETKNACQEVGGYRSFEPVPADEAGTKCFPRISER